MSSKGIWLTVLMRSAHFNSLTHFDEAQQPLLLHIPCYKSGCGEHRGLLDGVERLLSHKLLITFSQLDVAAHKQHYDDNKGGLFDGT